MHHHHQIGHLHYSSDHSRRLLFCIARGADSQSCSLVASCFSAFTSCENHHQEFPRDLLHLQPWPVATQLSSLIGNITTRIIAVTRIRPPSTSRILPAWWFDSGEKPSCSRAELLWLPPLRNWAALLIFPLLTQQKAAKLTVEWIICWIRIVSYLEAYYGGVDSSS